MFGNKIVIPESGKSYKVLANGIEAVMKYEGRKESNHCASCTCVSLPTWILNPEDEKRLGAGIHEIQILKEVK